MWHGKGRGNHPVWLWWMCHVKRRIYPELPSQNTQETLDIEKLKDPSVLETFQATIGGKFAAITIMNKEDTDMDPMITSFNTAVTKTANEMLGKHRQKKNLWFTADFFLFVP